jgi:hypothetical protein
MESKLLAGAAGICQTVTGLARHILWYLSYQVDGGAVARDAEAPARRRSR